MLDPCLISGPLIQKLLIITYSMKFPCSFPTFSQLNKLIFIDSLWPHRLQPTRLLCPWNSPGKNTGMGHHSLLQGIFLTQGSNPDLPRCMQILYCLSHQGSPGKAYTRDFTADAHWCVHVFPILEHCILSFVRTCQRNRSFNNNFKKVKPSQLN